MENKKYSKEELEALDVNELGKKKVISDILSAQSPELNFFERFMKNIFIPIAIPILTLVAGIIYFWFNHLDSEKAKALDRYKTEVEIVKMVWPDIKAGNSKGLGAASECLKSLDAKSYCAERDKNNLNTIYYNNSVAFLSNFYRANQKIYAKDMCILDMDTSRRPIYRLLDAFPKINLIVKNDAVRNTPISDTTKIIDNANPVVNQERNKEIVKVISGIQKNTKTISIYIQFSSKDNLKAVTHMANELKNYYIVPPVEFVKNISHYNNEIRFYQDADQKNAIELAERLKKITGFDFALKKIRTTNSKGTIEIWFDNSQTEPVKGALTKINITPKVLKDEYKTIIETDRYAARGFFNSINENLNVYVDSFDEEKQTATMRINNVQKTFKVGEASDPFIVDNYEIVIKVRDFSKNNTLRKVVNYSIIVRQKP